MATTYRSITVTGAAVVAFCLAVSFGPLFLFRDASPSLKAYRAAEVRIPAASQGSEIPMGCTACVQAARR
jgi:hypothetical protein